MRTIGRDARTCAISRPDDVLVNARHARLYRIGEAEYLMEEIGVVNGTFVNNVKLATGVPVAVRHGDLVGFGLVILTFWKPS